MQGCIAQEAQHAARCDQQNLQQCPRLPKRDPSLWLMPAVVASTSQRSSGVTRAVSTALPSVPGCSGSRAAKQPMLTALLCLHSTHVRELCHADTLMNVNELMSEAQLTVQPRNTVRQVNANIVADLATSASVPRASVLAKNMCPRCRPGTAALQQTKCDIG